MKKKIIAAVMAITLLFVVFAMTVSAYGDTYDSVDGYICIVSLADNGGYVDFFPVVSYDDYSVSQSISARGQCVVVYTDNTYSYGYKNFNGNGGHLYVYYDTNKTIDYVDFEVHIYENNSYVDTISDQISSYEL